MSKVSLDEMVAAQESEIFRCDAWESAAQSEGKQLHPDMVRRRLVAQRTVETLLIVKQHQVKIAALVRADRGRGS